MGRKSNSGKILKVKNTVSQVSMEGKEVEREKVLGVNIPCQMCKNQRHIVNPLASCFCACFDIFITGFLTSMQKRDHINVFQTVFETCFELILETYEVTTYVRD